MNQVLSSDLESRIIILEPVSISLGLSLNEYDFKGALEQSIEYFEQTAPLYQSGMGVEVSD